MKRILVADDDQQILLSIQRMLSPYYEVNTAMTATETLEKLDEGKYDGLIIDVEFKSGMNGLETVALLREEGHTQLKIIIFSATDYSNTVRQRAVELGAVFCEKPIEEHQIRAEFDGGRS
jgi:CheY-like chemotaxis protein